MRVFVLLAALTLCSACSTNRSSDTSPYASAEVRALNQNQDPKEYNSRPDSKLDQTLSDSAAATNKTSSPDKMETCIQELAANADDTVVDGWFFGQDPRMLKSFYRKIPPAQKAQFAMAYHAWMNTCKQDLISDFKSYVPYSKRADFAIDWWSKTVDRFNTQEKKQQVLWAHESIQDAGELWWRANEKLNPSSIDSPKTLAHDEEQKMVSKFMENENSPGSISDQVWKRTH